jgi:peptidoglycan/LPS O-acetylase OafA/YrhL
LTGLRVLAAVWVVLFHYRDDLEALAPWLVPLDTFMRAGYLGVDLFFPLSGFILAYNYSDALATFSWRGTRSFVQNRFARVWPVHVVALNIDLAIAAAVGGLGIGEDGHRRTPAAYVENLLLVHNWFNDRPSFNGPAWSIGSEWFAYLLAPLVFVLAARLTSARSAVCGAALSYAVMLGLYAAFALPNGNLEHLFFVRIVGEFVGGMLLCLAWVRGGRSFERWWPVLPAAVAAAALVPAASSGDYWLAPALGLVVAVIGTSRGRLQDWLGARWMVVAGEASFCLYMTHDLLRPVVSAVRDWGDGAGWSAAVALCAVALCLGGAAWGMHTLVERPARRLLQARSPRPESRSRGPVRGPVESPDEGRVEGRVEGPAVPTPQPVMD